MLCREVYTRPIVLQAAWDGSAFPVDPMLPELPVEWVEPVSPVGSAFLVGPVYLVGSIGPVSPVFPVELLNPLYPNGPIGPVGLVLSVGPAFPMSPVFPIGSPIQSELTLNALDTLVENPTILTLLSNSPTPVFKL